MVKDSDRRSIELLNIKNILSRVRRNLTGYAVNLPINMGDINLYLEIVQRLLDDVDNLIDENISQYDEKLVSEIPIEIGDVDKKIFDIVSKINIFVNRIIISSSISPDSRFYIQMIIDGLKKLRELLIKRGKLFKK